MEVEWRDLFKLMGKIFQFILLILIILQRSKGLEMVSFTSSNMQKI